MSDYIESLPTDDLPLNSTETKFMENILKNDKTSFELFLSEMKLVLIFGVLFLIINTPQVSDFIQNTIPYANSSKMSLLCFKCLLFMLLVFIYNNCNLVMRNTII